MTTIATIASVRARALTACDNDVTAGLLHRARSASNNLNVTTIAAVSDANDKLHRTSVAARRGTAG